MTVGYHTESAAGEHFCDRGKFYQATLACRKPSEGRHRASTDQVRTRQALVFLSLICGQKGAHIPNPTSSGEASLVGPPTNSEIKGTHVGTNPNCKWVVVGSHACSFLDKSQSLPSVSLSVVFLHLR